MSAVSLFGCTTSTYGSDDSGTPKPFGNDDCLQNVDRELRENPYVNTRQEAYDACRDAGRMLDELTGTVVTQP
jgi:hypothetical protein